MNKKGTRNLKEKEIRRKFDELDYPKKFEHLKNYETKEFIEWQKQREKKKRQKYYQKNRTKFLAVAKENGLLQRQITRDKVFNYYCRGNIRCNCCGETEVKFLTVDHIEGRKKWNHDHNMTGYSLWIWLVHHNFPIGFQILCMNCNWAKGKYDICPHKENTLRIKLVDDEITMLKKLQ